MTELKLIVLDTSKHVISLHGVNERGEVVLRRDLRRQQLTAFFRTLPPTEIVLEACGSSHHWGRMLAALGHRVRLIRRREPARGHASEVGVIAAKGTGHVEGLLERIAADLAVPAAA